MALVDVCPVLEIYPLPDEACKVLLPVLKGIVDLEIGVEAWMLECVVEFFDEDPLPLALCELVVAVLT